VDQPDLANDQNSQLFVARGMNHPAFDGSKIPKMTQWRGVGMNQWLTRAHHELKIIQKKNQGHHHYDVALVSNKWGHRTLFTTKWM